MQRRLLFFINPISGTKNKKNLVDLIEKKCASNQIVFEITHTNKEGDYQYLPEKINAEKITDVIICGGDGTIKQIASYLLNTDVNVGVIPAGSGNGLALGSGIGANFERALDIIFKGKTECIDGFYINGQFGCMLTGVGFDAAVAHEFSKQKTRGLFPYVKLSLQHFFKAKGYQFVIEWNGNKLETKALFVSIANSNQFGSRIKIAPKATLSDGLLDVIVVNNKNKIVTALSLLHQISLGKIQEEKKVKNKNVGYFHTENLTIHNPGMAPLHIDGEPVETSSLLEIKIIKKAIRLLLP
jgi:YegS/Rv2252/BmrU family lipid kinase